MRFLADQDVYANTVALLRGLGHDVVTAEDLALSTADDIQILQTAIDDRRILLTRDRDYGGLVYVAGVTGGVIYLRMLPATQNAVHAELLRVLAKHDESDLLAAFVVVEPARHRFRSISP